VVVSVALVFISIFSGVLWCFLSSGLCCCRGPGARSAVVAI